MKLITDFDLFNKNEFVNKFSCFTELIQPNKMK